MTWKPTPRSEADLLSMPLDAAQGFLLSQLDGTTDVDTLCHLTGFPMAQVQSMLGALVALGAVVPEAGAATPPPPPVPAQPEAGPDMEDGTTHRARFESVFRAMAEDQRVARARSAEEPDLSALCFDPLAPVVAALLENSRFGPVQARLVAAHHRTSAGLEALGARTAFAQDDGVRRALLRNPLLPPSLYRRLWSNRRLQEQFLVAISKDAPEQVRTIAREVLRATFTQRAGEERAELIVATEGRCLALLPTATLDGQATAILCRRTYTSSLFIQNLARWSACPPALVAHLRRQDLVKRNPVLKQMLERHPNAS